MPSLEEARRMKERDAQSLLDVQSNKKAMADAAAAKAATQAATQKKSTQIAQNAPTPDILKQLQPTTAQPAQFGEVAAQTPEVQFTPTATPVQAAAPQLDVSGAKEFLPGQTTPQAQLDLSGVAPVNLEGIDTPTLQDLIGQAETIGQQSLMAKKSLLNQNVEEVADELTRRMFGQNVGGESGVGKDIIQKTLERQTARLEPEAKLIASEEAGRVVDQGIAERKTLFDTTVAEREKIFETEVGAKVKEFELDVDKGAAEFKTRLEGLNSIFEAKLKEGGAIFEDQIAKTGLIYETDIQKQIDLWDRDLSEESAEFKAAVESERDDKKTALELVLSGQLRGEDASSVLQQIGIEDVGSFVSDPQLLLETYAVSQGLSPEEVIQQRRVTAKELWDDVMKNPDRYAGIALDPELEQEYAVQLAKAQNPDPDQGTVLCTELNRQGILDDITYQADIEYSLATHPLVIAGYHLWAIPLVEVMRKRPMITKLVTPFVLAWANNMAYKAGVKQKGNILGAMLELVGAPICFLLGSLFSRKTTVKGAI